MSQYKIEQTSQESTIMDFMQKVQSTMAPMDFKSLGAVMYDDNQELSAGVYGFLSPHWLYIDTLWVDENCRGQKLGLKLMQAIEQFALQQNINQAFLGTADFQARGFYEKLDYTVTATYQQFGDHWNFIMAKPLFESLIGNEPIEIQMPLSEDEIEALQAKLESFNTEHIGEFDSQPVFIVAYDDSQNLVGGVQGVLLPYDLHIGAVWLAEDHHQSHLLRDMLQQIEKVAQEQSIDHLIYRSDNPLLVKQFEDQQYIPTGAIEKFPNDAPTVIFEKHLTQ